MKLSHTLCYALLFLISHIQSKEFNMKQLGKAPERLEQYAEIAAQYNDQLPDLWNSLKPEERVFAYYMYRASLAGNRIMADQTHRDAVEVTELFERINAYKAAIKAACAQQMDVEKFLEQTDLFLVYLYAHHGQYFLREFENHKRTPERMGLSEITPCNVVNALEATGFIDAEAVVQRLHDSIFVAAVEPTVTVEGSIEKSAGNFYSSDFTEEDYVQLNPALRSALNVYLYVDSVEGQRVPKAVRYRIGGKYSIELTVAHFWLTKALEHVRNYPATFDKHYAASLEHMLRYLVTGDEEDFKKFSIEWIKTNSRVDFNFGFVEVYDDPKQCRGSFEADVTIKVIDMATVNALLPALEQQLPFPDEFKRQNLDDAAAIPNASVNAKLFGSGDAGPLRLTAAYCLPNYAEIRTEHGSKQIIYQQGKGLGARINPDLARSLFNIKEYADWLIAYDPEGNLDQVIWDVQVLLHETLGHGSGRLTEHTFKEGDLLTIGGQTYAPGYTIPVTSDNITEFIGEHFSALEELRAEIIALYISVFNFDDLAIAGLYKDWPETIGKELLIERLILHMAGSGLMRLMAQHDDAVEISQAHARANTAIMNYLLDHGGLELVEEQLDVNGVVHTVVGLRMIDMAQALQGVKDLAVEVQRIKSTGDTQAVNHLMKTYGTCVRHPKYIKTLKANRQAVQGDLKEVAEIYPRLVPERNAQGEIVDISAEWPEGFLEQHLELSKLALSTE